MSITRYYQPDLSLSDSSYRIFFFNEIPNLGYINTNIGADSTGLMADRVFRRDKHIQIGPLSVFIER